MTVEELIRELNTLPADAFIVMAKDGEGNTFSPLSAVSDGAVYEPESTWSGEIYHLDEVKEDEYFSKQAVLAIVLWPVN